ncbi:hypothetical protein TNIN_484771 [Trichonephila inaurata madagascariensis]|uniref:Uncharacterized protein n=1 Tax=Trichonephila inaurata madagascariensis TaxID=2747483 RepID=A0A8X6Y573_9ARAC|nr:hypothetical protein TNIN_484771 [Trichonephila inaurata madagascariensis]
MAARLVGRRNWNQRVSSFKSSSSDDYCVTGMMLLHVCTDGYAQDVSSPGAGFYCENLFEGSSAAGLGATNFDAEIEAVRRAICHL